MWKVSNFKRTERILSCIVKRTPVSAALTFYTEANELGMAGYKARNSSKVIQSPYSSVKKIRVIYHSNCFIKF